MFIHLLSAFVLSLSLILDHNKKLLLWFTVPYTQDYLGPPSPSCFIGIQKDSGLPMLINLEFASVSLMVLLLITRTIVE